MPLSPEQSNVVSSAIGGGASLIGSTVAGWFNSRENEKQFQRQRQLAREQYDNFINYSHRVGATPASIAQGMTHSGAASTPTVSAAGSPYPDFGSSLSSGVSAAASQRSATAGNITAGSEKEINDMKLTFEPAKYYADVQNALSQSLNQFKQSLYYGSLKEHYDELNKDLRNLRPWKLAQAQQTFLNLAATYDNIVQDTATKKSEEDRNYAQGEDFRTHANVNRAEEGRIYQDTYNMQLDQYKKQWEISLLAQGINPNQPFFENLKRWIFTDPAKFKACMSFLTQTIQSLDNKLQENLGEHYKRNALLGFAAYKYLQHRSGVKREQRQMFGNIVRTALPLVISAATGNPTPILGFANRGLY